MVPKLSTPPPLSFEDRDGRRSARPPKNNHALALFFPYLHQQAERLADASGGAQNSDLARRSRARSRSCRSSGSSGGREAPGGELGKLREQRHFFLSFKKVEEEKGRGRSEATAAEKKLKERKKKKKTALLSSFIIHFQKLFSAFLSPSRFNPFLIKEERRDKEHQADRPLECVPSLETEANGKLDVVSSSSLKLGRQRSFSKIQCRLVEEELLPPPLLREHPRLILL